MAENENRVSAVQEAPDSPQEPAALDTPPSEMPVYEPARPVRRVGTLTMGLALVVVGAALCVGLFFPNVDFLLLFKLSPLVLVALGCEVIFAASTAKGMRLKYDFLSMFVCFLLIVTALGAACVPVALQYAGPGRSAAEQRVEQELYEATYARLKGNGDIVNVTYDVHLGELRTPEDVTGAADLKAGDYVGVSAELKGTWATREEFVAACRPVIEAVRATGVRDPYISLYMRESRDTETPLYSLAVEGSYQADMTAEQLAQCVTERIYVDDAGYYMDAEELAGWQSEQSSAARDAELEALEAEWQARLDEAEAAAEQARAEAEERVAQAQAEADERVAQAQADADSRVAEAQANAADKIPQGFAGISGIIAVHRQLCAVIDEFLQYGPGKARAQNEKIRRNSGLFNGDALCAQCVARFHDQVQRRLLVRQCARACYKGDGDSVFCDFFHCHALSSCSV